MANEPLQGQKTEGQSGKKRRVRFDVLLGAFGLMFLYNATAFTLGLSPESWLARLTNILTYMALLYAAALAVSSGRGTRYAVRGFLLFVITLMATTHYRPESAFWNILEHGGLAAFVAWVSFLIIRNVWALQRADSEAIAAGLCAFLLLGLLWSIIYSFINHLDPTAFGDANLRFSGGEPGGSLYFSYVTLTTLGYGDIAPASPGARMFTMLEAIVGQVYLTVFVARLVGLSITGSRTSSPD
jgi:hypothetical protein